MPVKVESTPVLPGLSPVGGMAIEARFDAGCMSSDGGLLALREVEQRLAIASAAQSRNFTCNTVLGALDGQGDYDTIISRNNN
jgi:hypothetical protein